MSNNNQAVISTDTNNNANTYKLQVISGGRDVTHTRFAIANGLISTKKLKKRKKPWSQVDLGPNSFIFM